MDVIRFQRAGLEDVLTLQRISIQTFLDAYAESNSAENMARYIDESFSELRLTEELSEKNSEFYLAHADHIIGYIKVNLNEAQTDRHDPGAMELERIYVLKEYYGKGIGNQLMALAISTARAHGIERMWLGVWEDNPRALRFYAKHGFTAFGRHIFKLGDEEQWDVMMELTINT